MALPYMMITCREKSNVTNEPLWITAFTQTHLLTPGAEDTNNLNAYCDVFCSNAILWTHILITVWGQSFLFTSEGGNVMINFMKDAEKRFIFTDTSVGPNSHKGLQALEWLL